MTKGFKLISLNIMWQEAVATARRERGRETDRDRETESDEVSEFEVCGGRGCGWGEADRQTQSAPLCDGTGGQ